MPLSTQQNRYILVTKVELGIKSVARWKKLEFHGQEGKKESEVEDEEQKLNKPATLEKPQVEQLKSTENSEEFLPLPVKASKTSSVFTGYDESSSEDSDDFL